MRPKNRLDLFVNRTEERERFCELITSGEKPIMIVWGKDDLGKSLLLEWMSQECAQRSVAKAELSWNATRKYDPYGIMRKIRDLIGTAYFKPFTDLINFYTEPNYTLKVIVEGDLSVADKAEFVESKFRDLAGVIIKDSMISFPRPDIEVPIEERLYRLTDLFIPSLAAATKKHPFWIFLDDNLENIAPETMSWICEEILAAIVRGKLPNVRAVMALSQWPSPDTELLPFIEEASLQPFERQYVKEYLIKRGIDESIGISEDRRDGWVDFLMYQGEGVPGKVALLLEGMIRRHEKERRTKSG